MSNKKELMKRIQQKKENMNDLLDQIQADLTKDHLFHPKFLDFCKEILVNDAPLDVAMTGEKLKYMGNILRDTQKLMKEYNTLRQYRIQLKSPKETGNTKNEQAAKRKLDEEDINLYRM